MSQADQQSNAERRKRTKDTSESIIRVVDLNSGHKQPPLASKPSVVGNRCRSGYSLEDISKAITAARSNGDLFQVKDNEGRVRLGINDDEALLEKIETYLSRYDDPREDLIGLANKRIQFLRKQGDRDE
ncbi:hypothetical protein [Natronorubrum halophilum]|uniref:hypothetical protein n=1 Tax=Natronorubrum halophilum TaxID=1702106 RepID=UPI000EF67786|nr:hypothetical protein [Natronorubrum halophilum]